MPVGKFPLSIILQAIDKATATIGKVGGKLDKFSKRAATIGKSLTTSLTLPLVGIGVAGVAAFSKFEQGMSNVSTLIDTSKESMDKMGKEVLAIGQRAPVAVSDLTAALFDVRSAGVGAGDAMAVLEQSARLAVAGLGTTEQAVDLVTSSINAFGLEGEDAARIYDLVFKTTKFGKTNIAELSQGFGDVAATVANSGTELDEYLASVSALTTTGTKAAKAHTQLRAVLAGLTREGGDARKVFRKLGAEDYKDLIAKSGGLVPALNRIKDALGGNDKKMLKLFGSTDAVSAVIGLTGEVAESFTETLAAMRSGINANNEAFEKQNETSRAEIQRTKNALVGLGVSVGKMLIPVLKSLTKKIKDLIGWWASLDDGTKGTIVSVAKFAAVAGPMILVLGKIAAAIRIVNIALLASPIGVVVALAAAVGGLVSAISFYSEKIRQLEIDLAKLRGEEEKILKEQEVIIDTALQKVEQLDKEKAEDKELQKNIQLALANATPEERRIILEFKNPPPGLRVEPEDAEPGTFVGNQLVGAE